MIRSLTLVALVVCWSGSEAAGQLVVVRPGYVKAPFVRVYSYSDGSSYVRAPFVGIHSSGRRPSFFRDQNSWAPETLAELEWSDLRSVILRSVADLDRNLRRFPTGEVWRSHFATTAIMDFVAPNLDQAPADAERAELVAILANYDEALGNPDLRAIVELSAFRTLHAALREYLTPAETRLRWQLSASWTALYRELDQISTGAGWQKYLALPVLSDSDDLEDQARQLEALATALTRYDEVRVHPEYRMIARMDGFRRTHARLRQYLDVHTGPAPDAAAVEELPVPPPADEPLK